MLNPKIGSGSGECRPGLRPIPGFLTPFFLMALIPGAGNAIYMERQEYLEVPEAALPLESMLPQKGVESRGDRGYLKVNSEVLKRRHNIDFETREVEIISYLGLPGDSRDSVPLWQAYYLELNAYSVDMSELAWRRLWLNQFIGKEEATSGGGPGMLDIVLPVNVPDWMKRIGVDKPRLRINGSYKLVVEGSRRSGTGVPGVGDSWFPDLHMDQQPAFSVKGSIGRLINIEINSEEGFGTNLKEQLKITYKGEGDELEDNIIQEIEAGNTSLALTGTSLTGYTESHKGLFGLKMRMKFAGLEATVIASQEGGAQERQKLGLGSDVRNFVIEDRSMDLHRHFWLKLQDREDYRKPENWKAGSLYLKGGVGRRPLRVYELQTDPSADQVVDTATACAHDLAGNRLLNICETGRWKELKEGDFSYDEQLRLLSVPGGSRNSSLAARWQGDFLNPTGGATNPKELILLHSRSVVGNPALDSLMWRNVYSIGKVSAQDKDNFRIRLVTNTDSLERIQGDSLSFVRRLGLEKPDKPGQIAFDNSLIFNFDQGYMVLPCLSNASPDGDTANCLTPMKRVNPNTRMYADPLDEIQNGPTTHKFVVTGRQRKSTFDVRENSHSVSGSQCMDIEKGTEKLVLNGSTVLKRDVDYEVLYETGQITLISARARAPNADIDVSYECTPPFQISDKILLGTRLEYKLDNISEESMLGATLLYKSQSTTAERPELGREPFNQFLWGFNARLAGAPKWMTGAANLFPFVETEAPSRASFDFEVAQSRYNPNPKGSAFLEDFEGSQSVMPMPMTIYSWFKASPPDFADNGKQDEALDYRHQGLLIWHSSLREQYSRIYGRTKSTYTDTREQTLLKLTLQPNDNLEGKSWGGVMRGLGASSFNQSKKRTLEVVVQGREGDFVVDMGEISEDISIPGLNSGKPDNSLESELDVGREIVSGSDDGLDKTPNNVEQGVRWECKPTCYPIFLDKSTNGDPGQDRWVKPISDVSEQDYTVNGTEGNNKGDGGLTYDTEDLDRSGGLDTRNRYLRFVMPLDSACTAAFFCQELRNGWRKYQIPLYGNGKKVGTAGETDAQILSNVKIIRAWMGRLPSRVSKAEVLLARLNLVGNTWEEGDRNRDYEIDRARFASGDLRDSAAIRIPPLVSDSNRLKVDIINNQEEKGYFASPNTPLVRDTRTDEPIAERSLVLKYENLHRGEVVHATRLLGSDPKDLTFYDRILMEIHPDSNFAENSPTLRAGQNRISLGLRLGKDQGNRDSRDYYEIRLHMDTTLNPLVVRHRNLWERNSFEVKVQELTGLKNDPLYRAFPGRAVSRKAWHAGRGDSSLTLSVVGNPTLSRVDWMRLVVYVDSGAGENQRGEIWVNDLRLEGIDRSLGSAMRTSLQLDFSDFVGMSGVLSYRNGGFTTMSESKATPANSVSKVDYNSSISLYANKFFPDQWGISLPLTLQYHGALDRPFTRPGSDLGLGGTDLNDFFRDLAEGRLSSIKDSADSAADVDSRNARVYQTTAYEQKFSASYKKEHRSQSRFNQVLFERPDLQYAYSASERSEFFTENGTRTYQTKAYYSLSPYATRSYKPLGFAGKSKYMPKFLSDMDFTPYPDKLNLTLMDFSFSRSKTLSKPRNDLDIPLSNPAEYKLELTHGLDMAWRLLTFLSFDYRLTVNRNFDDEHECFDESFFTEAPPDPTAGCSGGIFARKMIFDLDGPDRNAGHLGDEYYILAFERNRSQAFSTNFNPTLSSWLNFGADYKADYRHTAAEAVPGQFGAAGRPDHFEAGAEHSVKLNSSLGLPALLGGAGDGKGFLGPLRKGMDKWRLRNFDGSYTVSQKYNGEEFTYDYLQGNNLSHSRVSPSSFYGYQFGMVYGGPLDFVRKLFDGEPNPRFLDYLSSPDTALGDTKFSHQVSRTWDGSSGFTVPWLDLALSLNLKYTKEYTLHRALQPSDTSVVWPDYTITGSLADFANRLPFLRKTFRSMTATSTFNYREEDKHALFSSAPETQKTSYKFDPLLRLAATTNKDVRGELSFKLGIDKAYQYEKLQVGTERFLWHGNGTPKDTSLLAYPRDNSLKTPTDGYNMGMDGSIAYDVETQKGLQFWRYYVKLENNLRLKVTSACTYALIKRQQPNLPPVRDQDMLTASIKPEVSYNFTTNVDALFYCQYKYDKLWHTPKKESTHEVLVHGEFTMRF